MRRVILVLLFVVSTVAVASSPRRAVAEPTDLSAAALDYISSTQGIPRDQLVIATVGATRLALTGVNLTDFKVMAGDGRLFGVSFDTARGQVVDADAAIRQERQTRLDTTGVVEPGLYDRMQRQTAERIPVAIWINFADPGDIARGPNANPNALAQQIHTAQGPVADAARGLGVLVAQADLAPVIFAELNAGQINALSHRPDVVAIDEVPQNLMRANDDSRTSDKFAFTTANGSGAKVAVHEDDGVDTANPFLVDPVYWCTGVGTGPGGAACTVGTNVQSHATNVAGVLASTHQWRRGGAWGIAAGSLLSANFQSFSSAVNIVNAASWALATQGADTVNMSWGGCSNGGQTFFTRWVDFLVKSFGDNIVVSSGNQQCTGSGFDPLFVLSPSLGWNTISVGSYWDKDTGLIADDVFSSFSSWKNPIDPNSGRSYEKPDVTGMGGQVDGSGCHGTETTGLNGNATDSTCGTSFAAPDVSALTALIVGKQPSLRNAAEAVKAIIMASATHNITDGFNYTNCSTAPVPGDCRDGAGAINAFQAIQNIVVPNNWRFPGFIDGTQFDGSGNIDFPVTIGANQNVRAAIAWDSTASCTNLGSGSQSCASDVLNADLDLTLIRPNGSVAAASASFQNSAEVVDFKTDASGTWKVRIHKFRLDAGTTTFLGAAWNLAVFGNLGPLTGATTFTLNTTKNNQTTDKGRSFWDTYGGNAGCASFLNPETGLEKVYKITTKSKGKITATLSNIVGYTGVNSDIDVIILKKFGSANAQNGQVVACGDLVATAANQPAGTYFIVVDGFAGSVAKYSLKVNFAAGTTTAEPEPSPPSR